MGAHGLRAVGLAAAAGVGIWLVPVAHGQTFTWNNAAGGTFGVAANWSPGVVPALATQTARFALPNTYAVSFAAGASNGTLDFAGGTVNFAIGANLYQPTTARFGGGALRLAGGTLSVLGSITISPGATVDTGAGTLIAGAASITGGRLTVSSDTGLRINQITLSSGTIQDNSNALLLGLTGLANNTVMTGGTIDGPEVDIGSTGAATLTQSGGNVGTTFAAIGANPGVKGTVSLSAGTFTTTSSLWVGLSGAGTLTQTGGSVFSFDQFQVANGPASTGNVFLSGGSIGCASAYVGVNGTGSISQSGGSFGCTTLDLGFNSGAVGLYRLSGGMLAAAGAIALAAGANGGGIGTLIQSGGALSASTISLAGAGGTFLYSAGSLTITAGNLLLDDGQLLGPNLDVNGTRAVSISGSTAVPIGHTLSISGGTFSTGTLIDTGGQIAFTSGTLRITGADFVVGGTGVLGDALALNVGQRLETTGTRQVIINGDSVLLLNGGDVSAAGGYTVAGQLVLASPLSGVGGGSIVNAGVISGTGRINASLINNSFGEVRAIPGDSLALNGGTVTNQGLFNVLGGTIDVLPTMINSGTIAIASGLLQASSAITDSGTISMTSGVISAPGPLTITSTGRLLGRGTVNPGSINNSGTIQLSGGLTDVGAPITNLGRTIVTGNSTSTFYGDVTNVPGSEFRVGANSTAVFFGTVTGLAAFTGPGTKDFEGAASAGAIESGGRTVVGPGGALAAVHVRDQSLSIEGVATIAPNGADAGVSRVKSLDIVGAPDAWTGRLDLTDNALVIDHDAASPAATVRNQIKTGYHSGAWTGTGITSSTAGGNASAAHKTSLGYADAADLFSTFPATFRGQSIDNTSVLVAYTFAGDANLDRTVDLTDFTFLAANFNGTNKDWLRGDFNYDGNVDLTDFTFLASNFNQTLPAGSSTIGAPVPEPATWLGVLAIAFFMPRRSRRAARVRR